MNLTIDIGNTRTKLGVFRGGELVRRDIWETLTLEALEDWLYNQKLENIILSSVVNVDEAIERFLKRRFFFFKLTEDTPLPIQNLYETPETLGKDRLAAVVGAFHIFPFENCFVIDAGTCITYDLLNKKGEYVGGNIAPGIDMRLHAMHAFTDKLPLAARNDHPDWLGKSTETALRSGGQWGAVMEMEAFIEKFRAKYRPLKVIITGGDADFFVKTLKTKIFANPNLVLIGLNKILNHNVRISG